MHFASRSGERGASSLEYAAMVALAGVLIGAILLTSTGAPLQDRVKQALCQAVSEILGKPAQCSTVGPPKTDQDFKPPKCQVSEQSTQARVAVKVLFFQIGKNAGFVETRYSDGTVTLTATNGGELGATGGFGAEAKLGDAFEAGAQVDFGADLKFKSGSTWKFKDLAEANAMRKQLNKYLAQQEALKDPDGGAMGVLIAGEEPPPKPPSEEITSVETTASVSGTLGIQLKAPIGNDTTGDQTGVGGSSTQTGEAKWVKRQNTDDGTTTYTTDLKYSPEVSGQLIATGGGGQGALGGSVALTVNSAGQIVGVQLTHVLDSGTQVNGGVDAGATQEGPDPGNPKGKKQTTGLLGGTNQKGEQQVVTTDLTLDPKSPEYAKQSKIVKDWLGGTDPANPQPLLVTSTSGIDVSVKDPNSPFQSLLYDQAKVSAIRYKTEKDGFDFALNVKLGVALGIEGGFSDTKSQAIAAQYLGAPQPNGTRLPQPFPECK